MITQVSLSNVSPRHRQHPSKRAEHMGRPTTRRCNRLSTRDLPVNSELRPVGRDLGAPVASAGLLDICKFAFVLRSLSAWCRLCYPPTHCVSLVRSDRIGA